METNLTGGGGGRESAPRGGKVTGCPCLLGSGPACEGALSSGLRFGLYTRHSGSFCNQIQEVADMRGTRALRLHLKRQALCVVFPSGEHDTELQLISIECAGSLGFRENAAKEPRGSLVWFLFVRQRAS